MKTFFIKCLITFIAIQKKTVLTLAILVTVTIVLDIRGNIKAARICLFISVSFIALMLFLSITCMMHRKRHLGFKVYLSFSANRIPELAQYIKDYLKQSFWLYNIDYYDFREHRQFHFFNVYAVCEEIDKNLANSDIFLRFVDYGLEPNKIRHVNEISKNRRFNSYTQNFSEPPDYYEYEVATSFDKFGFTNPNNRFQIMRPMMTSSPYPHIKTIYLGTDKSDLDLALRVVNELSKGYWNQIYRNTSALYYRMRNMAQ